MDVLVDLLFKESDDQLRKWGIQEHTVFEWLAFLTEEVGELAQSIADTHFRDGDWMDARDEAIQVATLALKIAEGLLTGAPR